MDTQSNGLLSYRKYIILQLIVTAWFVLAPNYDSNYNVLDAACPTQGYLMKFKVIPSPQPPGPDTNAYDLIQSYNTWDFFRCNEETCLVLTFIKINIYIEIYFFLVIIFNKSTEIPIALMLTFLAYNIIMMLYVFVKL